MPSSKDRGTYVLDTGAVGKNLVQVVEASAPKGPAKFAFQDVRQKSAPVAAKAEAPRMDPEVERQKLLDAELRGAERGMAEAKRDQEVFEMSLAARVQGALAALERALEHTEAAATKDAVRLALMIAEKIVRRTMAVDPEAVAAAVAATIEHTDGSAGVRVVCDNKTASTLRAQLDDLTRTLRITKIEVEEDARMHTGDLMLHRGSTVLDARVETRVQRIEQALCRELGFDLNEGNTNAS
jgi:flagellar biosynthesis/type III secretory pathway protein FliH